MIIDIGATAPVRPIMTFIVGNATYQYTGADLTVADKFKITNNGTKGWKMWIYDSLTFVFNILTVPVEICAIGHGGNADSGDYENYPGHATAWSGGNGGEMLSMKTTDSGFVRLQSGDKVSVTIGDSTSVIVQRGNTNIKTLTPTTGGGAESGWGAEMNDGDVTREASGGSNGSYAFGDSTFDGVRYAPGGGSGSFGNNMPGASGNTAGAAGAGGHGGGQSGKKGIVLMRYKE